MGKPAAVCTAICLALVVLSCATGELPPVTVRLLYRRDGYTRYNQVCFVGNDYFAEVLYVSDPWEEGGIYIRRLADPGGTHRHFAPGEKAILRSDLSGVSTLKNRLYCFALGRPPAVFDPVLDEMIELDEDSDYLDDYIFLGQPKDSRIPLNHLYYYDLYSSKGAGYKRGEEVRVPEGLKLGYIDPEKLHEATAFEQLFHEFNDGISIQPYRDFFGYDDKLKTWFYIHRDKAAFVYANRRRDGSWEGQKVALSDPKNRDILPRFHITLGNIHWKFLSPQHFIGPYAPYLTSDGLSLEILDAKGRVYPTGCLVVDSFDVSPNGRYVVAYGIDKNDAGKEDCVMLLLEINYQASINQKGAPLRKHGSLEGKLLKRLRQGQRCTVLEHSEFRDSVDGVEDCWYKIRLPNKREGWVFGAYLNFD